MKTSNLSSDNFKKIFDLNGCWSNITYLSSRCRAKACPVKLAVLSSTPNFWYTSLIVVFSGSTPAWSRRYKSMKIIYQITCPESNVVVYFLCQSIFDFPWYHIIHNVSIQCALQCTIPKNNGETKINWNKNYNLKPIFFPFHWPRAYHVTCK